MTDTYSVISRGGPGRRILTSSSTSLTAYTFTKYDKFIRCTGTFKLTLPAAKNFINHTFHVKNVGTGVLTFGCSSTETIDDQTTITLNQYDGASIISDGTEWWII